jgi:amidase
MLKIPCAESRSALSGINSAVATVVTGQSFVLETFDCYAGQIDSDEVLRPGIDMAQFNRATGPVAVEGVQAGDWILIDIERVSVGPWGVMALSPGLGLLGDKITQASSRIVPIQDGRAWITDTVSVEVAPMIGVLGVAPRTGEINTELPGAHGGNLDTRAVKAGNKLLLQAQHDGGLVSAGDLHAAQGDGELGGTGIEISGEIQLSIRKVDYEGHLPAVIHPAGMSVLSSAEGIYEAVRAGFEEAVDLMRRWHVLGWDDAYRLASIVSNAEISQLVNPLQTARITIPTEWCPTELG